MREEQLTFLTEDVIDYIPGPKLTGKQEYEHRARVQISERMSASVVDWQLPELPSLAGMDEVFLDLETTGLRWWAGDKMIGMGLRTPDGKTRYLPIRHKVGPNIPEEQFFRWFKREVRDKRVVNIRTKFDLHTLRVDGIDLEQQGCTFGDVAHYAALLDDHRRLFNQADLAIEFLKEPGKITSTHGFDLDPAHFAEYPAGLVAPRAEGDVETVFRLQQVMWPRMTAEDLHRVREIEDQTIPVVVEMEHNGCLLDVELLDQWCRETERVVEDAMWEIRQGTGCDLATPNKRDDIKRLFHTLGLEHPLDPETQEPSIADDLLAKVQHPMIQKLRCAIQVSSLRSKFLLKYQRSVARDGILRYELHQLPYQDDEGGKGGAVSGRFSSAAPSRDEGANLQQVFGVRTQQGDKDPVTGEYTGFTRQWLIKKLFKPDTSKHPNAVWLKADASQFQFRLFAHYANSPSVIEKYRTDPKADYHEVVQTLILEKALKELTRTHTKNVNFAQVFGAGIDKMAAQLGVSREIAEEISGIYHAMFPEVKPLLRLTSHLAMPDHRTGDRACGWACREFHNKGYRHRGFVKTFLGRRARFGEYDRHYSALNRIIQGTEGDVNKRVLIEVHKMRHELGLTLRVTVHDELDSDLHDPGNIERVKAVLNTQYYDFRVPILWDVGMGPTWADAK